MVIRQLVPTKITTYYSQNYAGILGSSLVSPGGWLGPTQVEHRYGVKIPPGFETNSSNVMLYKTQCVFYSTIKFRVFELVFS